ncbi:MAG: hypothetical protein J5535_00380 [Firmicutes bacterium]|nr:hypothetical protein [Bacillota bacterium]
MAEKKEKKLVAASESSAAKKKETITTPSGYTAKAAKPVGNAGGLRAGAVILWIVAIAFEALAILVLFGKISLNFMPQIWQLIAFLVLDLVCVIIGSSLWKKANHIAPASAANKVKFWLWNNLGLIVSCFAFIPIIILLLTNKDLDKKTKTIAVIVAIIALLIGGAASIDYNPVSSEELNAAETALGDTIVYWSPFGKVYHTHDDCQALNVSEQLTYGTVDEAIAANRTRLCKFCANRDNITTVVTDETK